VGAGDAPRFALFADPSDAASQLLQAHPDLLEREIRPPPAGDAMWLVRPDGYAACVAKHGDIAPLSEYLRAMA
jgi:hypothetical protein